MHIIILKRATILISLFGLLLSTQLAFGSSCCNCGHQAGLRRSHQVEQTLSIIKPDAVENHLIGKVVGMFERAGLEIARMKMIQLTEEEAHAFYEAHKDAPHYDELIEFMTSGPIIVQILEGKDAIQRSLKLIGYTDPKIATAGTLRSDYGVSTLRNVVHSSNDVETAKREISFFFKSPDCHSD